jgi:hypothetical protein
LVVDCTTCTFSSLPPASISPNVFGALDILECVCNVRVYAPPFRLSLPLPSSPPVPLCTKGALACLKCST